VDVRPGADVADVARRHYRIAVLAGGLSLEREVSLRSGSRVAEALVERGHDVARLDLDDGLVDALAAGAFDLAFLALHGRAGEDGTIQGLLELLDVPYTGPDAIASALAWDKVVLKGLMSRAGLDTPGWVALTSDAVRDMGAARALDHVVRRIGLPLIVKPAQGGACLGVRQVATAEQVPAALVSAFSYHNVVLVERFIQGAEVAVSIVDGQALPPVEAVPKEGAYDFSARYTAGATEFFVPARLDDETLARCQEVALAAYELAGCRHVTRADLMVDPSGRPWVLELDTCPGMTETSLLPLAAQAAGWGFAELCERLARLAVVVR
jgi:D-alanine-D-alanine ligase